MADEPLELPGGLGRRIGPLPLGAWIGAGVAGVALAFVWNRRRKSAGGGGTDEAAADLEAADTAAAPFLPTSFVVGGGVGATGSSGGASPSGDGTPTEPAPTGYGSNSAWRSAALSALIAKGYPGPVADDALARYLESQALTAQQTGLVQAALQLVGPAPDPVPAAPTPPPDPTMPASAPTPAPAPTPAAPSWTPPASWGSARFVQARGSTAIYLVRPNGIEWISSEEAFQNLGGSFGRPGQPAANYLILDPSAMRGAPRIGPTPPPGTDTSM